MPIKRTRIIRYEPGRIGETGRGPGGGAAGGREGIGGGGRPGAPGSVEMRDLPVGSPVRPIVIKTRRGGSVFGLPGKGVSGAPRRQAEPPDFPILRRSVIQEDTAQQVVVKPPPPVQQGGVADQIPSTSGAPSRGSIKEKLMPIDWGNVIADVGTQYVKYKYGAPAIAAMSQQPYMAPGPVAATPAFYDPGTGTGGGIPGIDIIPEPGSMMLQLGKRLLWDPLLAKWIKKPGRRRRRLLTPTDLNDLAALQTIVGKGDVMKFAVMKAVRR